jgi:hypothetical protein
MQCLYESPSHAWCGCVSDSMQWSAGCLALSVFGFHKLAVLGCRSAEQTLIYGRQVVDQVAPRHHRPSTVLLVSIGIGYRKNRTILTQAVQERERGRGARGYTFVPLRRGRCRRARHGRAVQVLAVAEAKAWVLAVAEDQVASTGSGSRRRRGRWPAVELLAAAALDLDRLGLHCRWGGGGGDSRDSCRWPSPVYIAQRDGGPPAKNELGRPRSRRGCEEAHRTRYGLREIKPTLLSPDSTAHPPKPSPLAHAGRGA